MTERPVRAAIWTEAAVAAYAELHALTFPDAASLSRLRTMLQKAADTTAALPRDFGHEDQPAFAFVPGRRS